jgi:hypothetical protein
MKFDKRIKSKIEGMDDDLNKIKNKKLADKNVKFEEEVSIGEPE